MTTIDKFVARTAQQPSDLGPIIEMLKEDGGVLEPAIFITNTLTEAFMLADRSGMDPEVINRFDNLWRNARVVQEGIQDILAGRQ